MRRVHLQGRNNILKRLLVHGAAFNLSLILRKAIGVGKPRRLQGLYLQFFAPLRRLFGRSEAIRSWRERDEGYLTSQSNRIPHCNSADSFLRRRLKTLTTATGC
jgi:hypothetical protein